MPKLSVIRAAIDDVFRDSAAHRRADIFDDVLNRYQQRHRHHHDLFHIADILERVDAFDLPNPRAVKAAAIYHDVVYKVEAYAPARRGGPSNEMKSSDYAQRMMQTERVPAEITRRASDLILMTEKHNVPDDDGEAALFMDLDMRVLGADRMEYDTYAVKTAAEFLTFFPPQDYIVGRKHFLATTSRRSHIFLSPAFAAHDDIARQNMAREMDNIDRIVAIALSRYAPRGTRQTAPHHA